MFRVQILDRYPQTDHEDSPFPMGIPLFCVPEGGLRVSDTPDLPRFYFFACTLSTGEKVFGACLAFQEELDVKVRDSLLLSLELEDRERLHNEQLEEWEASGCKGPRPIHPTPLPKLLREKADDILTKKNPIPSFWTTKCICLLSHFPYLQQFRQLLNEIYRLTLAPCKITFEQMVMHLMDELPLPPPGVFNVHTVIGTTEVIFSRPPLNNTLLPCAVSVSFLFQNLSLENILTIIEALLLERRVLILSDRLSALAPACEALLLLLYPFRWQHVYVPLLPKMLNGFLHAPMPFFIGAHSSVENIVDQEVLDEMVVVFLDRDQVAVRQPLEAQIPIKERQKLMKSLHSVAKQLYSPPQSSELQKDGKVRMGWGGALADCAITLAPLPEDEEKIEITSENEMAPEDIEETIRKAFFRIFVSLFRDVNDYFAHPIDISKLSIPFPLPISSIPASLNGNSSACRSTDYALAPSVNTAASHLLNISLNSGFGPGKVLDPPSVNTSSSSSNRSNSVARRSSMMPSDKRESISRLEDEDRRASVSSLSPTSSGTLNTFHEDGNESDTFFNSTAFLKKSDPHARPFLSIFIASQAFQRFVDEHTYPSLAAENAHHLLFFRESLIEKQNRHLFSRRQQTPFLLSPLSKVRAYLHAPPLAPLPGSKIIIYPSFPTLNYDNFPKTPRYPTVQFGPPYSQSVITSGTGKQPHPPVNPPPQISKSALSPTNNRPGFSFTGEKFSEPDSNGFLHLYLKFTDVNPEIHVDERPTSFNSVSSNESTRLAIPVAPTKPAHTPTTSAPVSNKNDDINYLSNRNQVKQMSQNLATSGIPLGGVPKPPKEPTPASHYRSSSNSKSLKHELESAQLLPTALHSTNYISTSRVLSTNQTDSLYNSVSVKKQNSMGISSNVPRSHVVTSIVEMKKDVAFPEAGCLLPIYLSLYLSTHNESSSTPIPPSLRQIIGFNAARKLEKLAIQAQYTSLDRSLLVGAPPPPISMDAVETHTRVAALSQTLVSKNTPSMSKRFAIEDSKSNASLAYESYCYTCEKLQTELPGVSVEVICQCDRCNQKISDAAIRNHWKRVEAQSTVREYRHESDYLEESSIVECPYCNNNVKPVLRYTVNYVSEEIKPLINVFTDDQLTIPYISVFTLRRAIGSIYPGLKAPSPSVISSVLLLKPQFKQHIIVFWSVLFHLVSLDLPIGFILKSQM